jgi:hypothetical protein
MSATVDRHGPDHAELVCLYAMRALPANEVSVAEANLSECALCRRELDQLRPIMESFVWWPTDVLRPSDSLWQRLVQRIAPNPGLEPMLSALYRWVDPEWSEVAPGISCKMLANDSENRRVSMLVRLAPGTHYPPHRHADVEELHLLVGELWIEDRRLVAGDYSRREAGSEDRRVWSETGCTCLLITSARDELR